MEIITEIFEAIDSQYLLVLAVVLVFLFTKEGFFSSNSRYPPELESHALVAALIF